MDFLTSIVGALVAAGPIGLIAALELLALVACGWGLWHFIKQRGSVAGLIKSNADKVEKMQIAHSARLSEVHNGYQAQLAELNEKRIQDIKEASEDYSTLATQIQETLNRLTLQLEIRGRK